MACSGASSLVACVSLRCFKALLARDPGFDKTPTNLISLSLLPLSLYHSIHLCSLVHVKMISYVAISVGHAETVSNILPLLDPLSEDHEPAIKQQLLQQMTELAKFSEKNGEEGYLAIIHHILPVTAKLLEDEKAEVRFAASQTLVEIANLLKPEDLGQHILTVVLQLAHEDDSEETRMTAAELLNMLAECLGQDLCQQFIIPEIVSLAEDPVFRVRKSTALNFHNICKVGGEYELFERLMPAFVRLSKDDMYRVRRACADSIYNIAQFVSDDIKVGVLVEIFLRFTQDPSRLVKQSVLQQSGKFLSTLPSRCINEALLGHYSSMASGPTGDIGTDNELCQHCAFTFPAVALAVGKARWGEIKTVYHEMIQSRNPEVRMTLAASLHEIAKFFGEQRTVEEELIPIFEELIQDIESVQMGVVKHLAEFLEHLSRPCRISYIPQMHNILHQVNPFNWRFRESLAVQLPVLLDMPGAVNVYATLFPLVMTLLQDPVASVRKASFVGVAKMIVVLAKVTGDLALEPEDEKGDYEVVGEVETHKEHLDSVIRAVNSLAVGETFQLRQLWAELALSLLKKIPRVLFEKHFLDGLLLLTPDPISNVRIAIADVLTAWAPEFGPPPVEGQEAAGTGGDAEDVENPWEWLLTRDDIRECAQRFQKDEKDVYLRASRLQPYFTDMSFVEVSVNGTPGAPGGNEVIRNSATGVLADEAFSQYGTGDERSSLHGSDISSLDVERANMALESPTGGLAGGLGTEPFSSLTDAPAPAGAGAGAEMGTGAGGAAGAVDTSTAGAASPGRGEVPARPASPPQDEDLLMAMMAMDPLAETPVEEEQSTEPEFQPVPKDM